MRTIDYKAMGARIRTLREQFGYTREELAEKLNISTKFCSDIELGVKGVSLNTLAKITNLFNATADYILFGESDSPNTSTTIETLVKSCPDDKLPYAEELLKTFLKAVK
jgi:transcriptional regulator with XRE-family HTH domain